MNLLAIAHRDMSEAESRLSSRGFSVLSACMVYMIVDGLLRLPQVFVS